MKQPGECLSCPYCGEPHIVKEDEDGFSSSVKERKFYIVCPVLEGRIHWAVLPDA